MECLTCHSQFPTLDLLTCHFNTQGAQCIATLKDGFQISTPPVVICGAGETNVQGEFCKYSGYHFGKMSTLLNWLKADKHDGHWEHQLYYLFVDERKWNLETILATLTKAQVSRILKSKWMHLQCTPTALILTLTSSIPMQRCLLEWQINFLVGLQTFQLDHSGRPLQLNWMDMRQFGVFIWYGKMGWMLSKTCSQIQSSLTTWHMSLTRSCMVQTMSTVNSLQAHIHLKSR